MYKFIATLIINSKVSQTDFAFPCYPMCFVFALKWMLSESVSGHGLYPICSHFNGSDFHKREYTDLCNYHFYFKVSAK